MTHHCGNELHEEFKLRGILHDVLCCLDYAEKVESSFANQIKPEYYRVNVSEFKFLMEFVATVVGHEDIHM